MKNLFLLAIAASLTSCAVIRPGEAGIKQRFGKFQNEAKTEGVFIFNPITSKVVKESIQTNNLEMNLNLPSKEGLSVDSEISILYHLETEMVPQVLQSIGRDYRTIIASVFRSASADVCSQFFAKDMHSGKRADIEEAIRLKMDDNLNPKGIVIEAVLMKSIQLPPRLSTSIEQKLQAEQDAMRLVFILEQARLQAERKIIDATGERDAQLILAEGLTPEIIKIRSIEALEKILDFDQFEAYHYRRKDAFLDSGHREIAKIES
jgi:Membrane protease subunits, stomatin/prohibitin homologs